MWQPKTSDSEGATGTTPLRNCQKLPCVQQSQCQLVPKWICHLAKAKPVSNSGSASGIMRVKRKKIKKLLHRNKLQPEKGGVGLCDRSNYTDFKVSVGGGGRGAPGAGADIPLQPGGLHTKAGECLKEGVTMWEAHTG